MKKDHRKGPRPQRLPPPKSIEDLAIECVHASRHLRAFVMSIKDDRFQITARYKRKVYELTVQNVDPLKRAALESVLKELKCGVLAP